MCKGNVLNKFNSVFLFVLLLFGNCGVSSFGSEESNYISDYIDTNNDDSRPYIENNKLIISNFNINSNTEFYPIEEENSCVLNNFFIVVAGRGNSFDNPCMFDNFVNFVSKGMYFFGYLNFYCSGDLGKTKKYLNDIHFFNKESWFKNFVASFFATSWCNCNFFSMKRYNLFSRLPFNSDNKVYLGVTDIPEFRRGFLGEIVGSMLGGLLGRVALELDLSLLCKKDFVKNKITCTIFGVRPLWLIFGLIQNNTSYDIIALYGPVSSNKYKQVVHNTCDDLIYSAVTYFPCVFQVLALEFKIHKYLYLQFFPVNVIVSFCKFYSNKIRNSSSLGNEIGIELDFIKDFNKKDNGINEFLDEKNDN